MTDVKNIISIRKEIKVWKLHAQMNVRYWNDATINGKECESSEDMPLASGDMWIVNIDIESGSIDGWPDGTTADVHFKVCDAGTYELLDFEGETVFELDGYVPKIMCPNGRGYGDYVIMTIDENGNIENWKIELDDFQDAINEQF